MVCLKMILLFLLCSQSTRVLAGVERWHHGFIGEFSIVNHGRMPVHTVLMFLKDMDLPECIDFCMKHLRCVTVSYNKSTRECELNDMEFDDIEATKNEADWINYSTPPMVQGGFSDWKIGTDCSTSCGEGTKVYYRLCDNPRPQFGGDGCEGVYTKTEPCNLGPCLGDNIALKKPSHQSSTYDGLSKFEAKNANDGDLMTRSVTALEYKGYWFVNLETPIEIKLIRLYLEKYGLDKGYYNGLTVQTSINGAKVSPCENITPNLKVDVTCGGKRKAQYVRVMLVGRSSKTPLYLKEVEIYKYPTNE